MRADSLTIPATPKAPSPLRSAGALHILLAVLLLLAPRARAQVVADGATNTLNNVTNSYVGDVTIGTNGSFTLLTITNGALLTNTADAYIGRNTGANSNTVRVTGANSRWFVNNFLNVGNSGSFNSLLITNGGTVANGFGYIGFNSSASNNQVTVTGTNSLWTNSGDLTIGYSGSFNTLLITNGGTARAALAGWVGFSPGANSNRVIVSGSNSLWQNALDTTVGHQGAGNSMLITGGGRVANDKGWIGRTASASNNSVTVTGANSLWNNAGFLRVGADGSFNMLLISNGATVANTAGYIGTNAVARNNQVTVTGTNSLWTNSSDLYVGNSGAFNSLLIANGGVVASTAGSLGYSSGANSNVAWVTGSGSLWTNSGNLRVGESGSGNRLVVSNGGAVASLFGSLGFNPGASNNVAVVTGTNSVWRVSNQLTIGYDGGAVNNQLVVSGGGTVLSSDGAVGSFSSAADNNSAWVTDPGSLWSNSANLLVGDTGSGNQLVVSNGGTVSATNVTVGANPSSTGNRVTVDGGTLRATNAGGTATYDIRRGTNVLNAGLIVADRLLLTNTAAFFTFNGGTLITRAATVNNGQDFVVGANAGFTNATWDVRSNATPTVLANGLFIGSSAGNSTLLITNGATLSVGGWTVSSSFSTFFGFNPGSSNNRAIIAGPNSLWTNSGTLRVGSTGSGNQLVVSNGGVVANGSGFIGDDSIASNNVALITGTNSRWINTGLLFVGYFGSGNQLVVSNAGVVANGTGFISGDSTANNNVAVVTGAGSLWTNSGNLFVGASGSGNQLVVSNGGVVASGSGFIGDTSTANNNVAVVTGAGSLWTNSGNLSVGIAGSGNQLVVSNGGVVSAANVFVGANSSSTGNRLTVDGGTLRVTNAGGTAVLDIRRGTNVLNAGLIVADNLVLNNGTGFFTFNGGTLDIRSATVANGAIFTVGNGTSNATYRMSGTAASSHSFANNLVIASNATFAGNGTITGTVTNFGTIYVGSSAGSLTINGDLRLQSSSMLTFEIGGLIATNQYDQLTVTSFAELAGTLSLALLPNFLPDDSDTFTLMKFGSWGGPGFANAPALGRVSLSNNLASFAVNYSLTNLVLGGVLYTDSDGDGQGDLQEAAAGTDPAVSASVMQIVSVSRVGEGPVTLRFTVETGKNYRIEWSGDLVTWSQLTGTTVFTDFAPGLKEWVDNGSQTGGLNFLITNRFYRVGLE